MVNITKQDIDECGATVGCPGCNAIKGIEARLRITPHEAERLDRRSEVVNGALAEEIQGGEQRKERSSRVTTAAPAPKFAASTSHELRENPIEHDPNPKKRLHMKSASSAASSRQQRVERVS